jgi:hypothetical protein
MEILSSLALCSLHFSTEHAVIRNLDDLCQLYNSLALWNESTVLC